MKRNVVQVVVGLPVDGSFDYALDPGNRDLVEVGMRVKVSFNRRTMVGYVVGFSEASRFKRLNPVQEILDNQPTLSDSALAWTRVISEYFGCSWGEAIEASLPPSLRKARLMTYETVSETPLEKQTNPGNVLICDPSFSSYWEDVLQWMRPVIENRMSVIILVPEKKQTKDVEGHLKSKFTVPILVIDKKLSVKDEIEQFQIIRKTSPIIVIGTRRAVFTHCLNLGLIVQINEEDESFKEEQSPYYLTRSVAEFRSQVESCALMCISANPTIEARYASIKSKWRFIEHQPTHQPTVQLVDMTNYNPRKTSILSFPLQNSLQKMMEAKEKGLLYFNRKGFNTSTHCNSCGHIMTCKRCDARMIYMYSSNSLVCTKCGNKEQLPKYCPQCNGPYLKSIGRGIEKLESEVHRYYPQARVAIFDKETKTIPKNVDLILATSAIFNQINRYKTDLVAVLQFDNELYRTDFRSGHKALSDLLRLKQMARHKMIIQTKMPDNIYLKTIRSMDLNSFYKEELKMRKELNLPPYKQLIALALRGADEDKVFKLAVDLVERLRENVPVSVEVLDPFPDMVPKLRDKFRYTIILKVDSSSSLLQKVKSVLKEYRNRKNIIITVNVNP